MEKTDLIIILVIYKKRFIDIPSFDLIKNILTTTDLKIQVIIYDNSPEAINSIEELPAYISYINNKNNPGLATAYNYGLEVSIHKNCDWLLLLDHDTELTTQYFMYVFDSLEKNNLSDDVVAIMPIVRANGEIIAPVKTTFKKYHYAINKTGKLTGNITGINSGTVVRVSFVNQLGGFNLNFPLDYLDHWLFDKINKASKYIYVLDTIIYQNLSINDFKANVDKVRYNSILKAKVLYYKDQSLLFSLKLKYELMRSLLNHLLHTRDKQYAFLAFKYLIKSFK